AAARLARRRAQAAATYSRVAQRDARRALQAPVLVIWRDWFDGGTVAGPSPASRGPHPLPPHSGVNDRLGAPDGGPLWTRFPYGGLGQGRNCGRNCRGLYWAVWLMGRRSALRLRFG